MRPWSRSFTLALFSPAILLALVSVAFTMWLGARVQTSWAALPAAHLSGGRQAITATRPPETSQSLTPTPVCDLSWQVVTSPSPSTYLNYLFGASAVSANDVWAVGTTNTVGQGNHTLIERWNGTGWSIAPSPDPTTDTVLLNDVAAISASDVWAVGYYADNGPARTLTLHWNGIDWRQISSPNVGSDDNALRRVSGDGPDNIWAVGYYVSNGHTRTLVEHWDGNTWAIAPSPDPTNENNDLQDVITLSPTNAWAVGVYVTLTGYRTLVEHWDGAQWSIVPSPSIPNVHNVLYGVAASSADDIWAVGYTNDISLVEHWDGSTWSIIPSPNVDRPHNELWQVVATSTNDAWAVGHSCCTENRTKTFVIHWDGHNWTAVSSPSPGAIDNHLLGLASVSADDLWAVGYSWNGSNTPFLTMIEHYSVVCLAPTPTTTGVATTTATATTTTTATGTMTATVSATVTKISTSTSTPCVITFTDVHPSGYFYEPVRYLYCLGVIAGYGDNTFRPYNLTTRGQLAKIVVLAQGWVIYTPPTATFRDVLVTDPFYQYIETTYNRGIISGYSCGTGCLEYRPGNNVTRGQLCKIVVLAEGWTIYMPPTPTFRDVPTTDPFYRHIETAYQHGIISGYSCGPDCLEFRPGNNATRGQICKIVYLAVTAPQAISLTPSVIILQSPPLSGRAR